MSSRCFTYLASIALALAISLSLVSFGRLNRPLVHAQQVASNSGAVAQPSPTPAPTGQPSPTTSPTAGTPSATPGSSQPTAASSGASTSGQSGGNGLSIRLLLLLALGGVGILLGAILAIRRRLQEMKRLAAEAKPKQDTQPPEEPGTGSEVGTSIDSAP